MARRHPTPEPMTLLGQDGAPLARPSGHTSVMSGRAPAADDLDFFPTPPWAARAGGELIKRLDPDATTCWEPACGEGHMAHGLADYFDHVTLSDVHDYGIGAQTFDFLSGVYAETSLLDWIVTNPPFVRGEAFVRAAMPRARRGVAMLLRLVFLEGAGRYRLLYEDLPLTVCAPFAERVPMVKGRWDPDASSATAYAWFVWLKLPFPFGPRLADYPALMPIRPGARARLTRRGDAARFGAAADCPLFDPSPTTENPE